MDAKTKEELNTLIEAFETACYNYGFDCGNDQIATDNVRESAKDLEKIRQNLKDKIDSL